MKTTSQRLRLATVLGIALFTAVTVRGDGLAAFERGDYAQAARELAAVVAADDSDTNALFYLARARFALDDLPAAAAAIDRVSNALPDNPDAHFWRGRIYGTLAANANMLQAGKYAKVARAAFERALAIDPGHREGLIGLIEFKRQAPKIVGGSKPEALALTDRLIRVDAVTGALFKADVLTSLRRDNEARALLDKLLATHPEDPTVRLRLGFEQQADEDYDGALEHFAAAAAAPLDTATPEQANAIYGAMYQLGRSHVLAKTASPRGADALRRYIANAPVDASMPGKDWANFRLAQLLELNGERDEARVHFEAALAMTEDDNLARRAKSALK